MKKKQRRRLQKALNHTTKAQLRMRQAGLADKRLDLIQRDILTVARDEGVKLKVKGGKIR